MCKHRGVVVAFVLALAVPAAAQVVDCSNPDNLCTGDPCVIPKIEPATPCVADFGARAVVILGLRNVEEVDLRSELMTVAGPVSGRSGMGGMLTLRATELTVEGPISFDDESIVGISASDRLTINAPIHLTGGDDTPLASLLELRGQSVLELNAPIVNLGGADEVIIEGEGVSVAASIVNRRNGEGPQPPLRLAGTGVGIGGPVNAGGSVVILGEDVGVQKPIRAAGDEITIQASEPVGGLAIDAPVKSTGRNNEGRCGPIRISAGKGTAFVNAPIVCAGRAGGDGITIEGNAVEVNDVVRTVSKDADGGNIVLDAYGIESFSHATVTGQLLTRGSQPGDVVVTGRTISFEDAAVKTSAKGGGGAQRYTANDGDVVLQGSFVATKGGTIQATATANITTDGSFSVGAGGCIGLSAGGTVTTGSSVFDQMVQPTCP